MGVLIFICSNAMALDQAPLVGQRDRDCGATEQFVELFHGIAVYARCADAAAGQVMHLGVENPSDKPLIGFGIGFCENLIVEVGVPAGWQATRRGSGNVDFTVRDETSALLTGKRIDGFTITLKRPWMMSSTVNVQWIEGVAVTGTSHDCPP